MLTTYRRVFANPGAVAFSLTGLVARLPISMMTLGIVLLVSTLSGSYAEAGQVSAAYILGNALVAIPQGRLADRFGQRPVLLVDAVVFALGTGMLIRSETAGWPTPWPHVWAAVTGIAIPQVGSMVRARWAHLLADPADRQTAFSVEAVVDEVVFVTGPALVTFLSTLASAQAGLLAALVFGIVGPVVLAAQDRTAPPTHPRRRGGPGDRLPWRSLAPMTLSAASMGALFGAMEVATVAFSGDVGHKALSGVVLATMSAGSLLAGLLTGARTWRSSLVVRFRVGSALLAVGFVVLPFLHSLATLTPMMFLVGFAIAPTLIACISLLEEVSPRSRLTEAMAFLQTGISAGIAPGAWYAGVVADRAGGAAAFWVCVGAGVLAALAATVTPGLPRGRVAFAP
ncbi:MAG TPA: MFS transporter [Marmoricola sp.]|nr:MFS transporter [Marmoricola sp.]